MARRPSLTRAELEEKLARVQDLLDEVYDSESIKEVREAIDDHDEDEDSD